jgi:hypothetical protein
MTPAATANATSSSNRNLSKENKTPPHQQQQQQQTRAFSMSRKILQKPHIASNAARNHTSING